MQSRRYFKKHQNLDRVFILSHFVVSISFKNAELLLLIIIIKVLSYFNFLRVILYVWVLCLHVCAPSVYSACQGQEEVSDPLDLDVQAVVSPHVC